MSEGKDLLQDHINFHRDKSNEQVGYIQNGQVGFMDTMDKWYNDVWPGEKTSNHVLNFIKQRLSTKQPSHFLAYDIGAGHNYFLRELADVDPRIICQAVALGDPRSSEEKTQDETKHIGYTLQPIETIVDQFHDIDLVHCSGTLQHIARPLSLLKSLYDACAPGGELYVEWNGKGQTSQVDWDNGSFEDFISELKTRGMDIHVKDFIFTKLLRIKVNGQAFPEDFFTVSEPTESIFVPPMLKIGTPAVKSTVTLFSEKMLQKRINDS